MAVVFSAAAIPVLSGFLRPSQPPAVGAIQIGDRSDEDSVAGARDDGVPAENTERPPADDVQRRRPAPQSAAPTRPRQTAPSAPADAAEDDGGEAD